MPKIAIETATGASKVVHDTYEPLPGEVLKDFTPTTAPAPEPKPELKKGFEPLPVEDEEIDED